MVLRRKLWRTMKEHKSRYVGSFLLIILSSMLFVSFHTAGPSVREGIDRYLERNQVEDAQFATNVPLTDEDLARLRERYEVKLETRFSKDVQVGKATLRVLKPTSEVNIPEIREGESLQSADDIWLDPQYASNNGYEVGEEIDIQGDAYRVKALFTAPDYIYTIKSNEDIMNQPKTFGLAMMTEDAFEALEAQVSPLYSVRFTQDNREAFQADVHATFTMIHWLEREDNSRIVFVNGDVEAFTQVGTMLPVGIILVTCFLITIVLWRLLKGEYVQIGTLYALGYRRNEIMRHYLQYSIWIALLGGAIGTGCGYWLAGPLLSSFDMQYNLPDFSMHVPIYALLIGIALPVCFLLPASWFVIRGALRRSPLQLMRGEASGTKAGWLECKISLKRFSFNKRFQVREILRNIPRSIVMFIGVVFSSMMLLLGFVTVDSVGGLIQDQVDGVYQFDYRYSFRELQQQDVEGAEKASVVPYAAGEEAVVVNGVEPGAKFIQLVNMDGDPIDFSGITATRQLAEQHGWGIGDTVELANQLNGQTLSVQIDEIADAYNGPYLYLPLDALNEANGWPPGSYTQLMSDRELAGVSNASAVEKKQDIVDGYESMIQMVSVFIGSISVVAAVIAVIFIYIITSMIIEENRGTISLMKVLGYSKKQIRALILNSNTIIVVIGYIVAIPLIMVSMDGMFAQFTAEMNLVIPTKLQPTNMAIGFVMIWIAYDISRRLSRRTIEQVSMAESLKSRAE